MQEDIESLLQQRVSEAFRDGVPLSLRGGGTKTFYGHPVEGRVLEVGAHRGIVNYEPTELVITARAGTPLDDLEEVLAGNGQMLGFEPPRFGTGATLGGTIACNLSGPRRSAAGAARDFVLGCRLINGRGEILRFGGEVMKNVAGYDVSRLMAGSFGTLGVLLEVSLKVLPVPETERTFVIECSREKALKLMNAWAGQSLPVSASCHDGTALHVRLSGAERSVRAAQQQVGGEAVADGDDWWRRVREHRHGFFTSHKPLWCLSVPSLAPVLLSDDKSLLEWGGARRWLLSEAPAERIRARVTGVGGHAVRFRRGDPDTPVFAPLPEAMMRLHQRLKAGFDPAGILNPGRMYRGL